MLQSMRDKAKSWVTFVVVGIIAFMMAITGLETLAPNPNNPEVATVNGQEITQVELAQAVDQQRRALIQQMGGQFDPAMLDETLLQESVLKALIDRQLLLQNAEDHKMGVGTAQVDQVIVGMEQFQQNGQFDPERFQMMVRSFGMTPLQFKQAIREDTLLQQMQAGVAGSEFVTIEELRQLRALEGQTRDLSWVVLKADAVRAGITVSEAEIQAYYDANASQFMTPEQVVVDYLQLNKSALADSIDIAAEDIEAEYRYRVEQLQQQSANDAQVSVILIQTGAQRTVEQAQARAEEVLAKLQDGADFAELASTYSDDAATAANGGELGAVEPGFFGAEFDAAVAALAEGEVSDPIVTDSGVQILQVTARGEAEVPTLNDMRQSIEVALKRSEVDSLFLEQSRELADISFESADLAQPAEQLGLTVMTSEPFGRNGAASGIASDPRIAAAAFSDDVLSLGANSDLVEVTPEQAVVVRVREHLKPQPIPLAQVRDSIATTLQNRAVEQQLTARAADMIATLTAGTALPQLAKQQKLTLGKSDKSTRNMADVPAPLLRAAFKLPNPGEGVVYDSVALSGGDYAVLALSGVYPGDSAVQPEELKTLGQFIANSNGRLIFEEFLASLRERGNVEIALDTE